MDEPTINKPVDRSDNSSAVNNRYNHNWSVNDCSFMMHEANILNMDTRRELVHKPDKVGLANRYLLCEGMELKQKQLLSPINH